MSSVAIDVFSKPSKIHNLAYIIFGYTSSFSLIPKVQFVTTEEYLIFVTLVGGFIGTFLFFLKPLEKILWILLRYKKDKLIGITWSSIFNSPYLIETKGKILSGFYFFLTCIALIFFNSNFILLNAELILFLQLVLGSLGIVVLLVTFYELKEVNKKLDALIIYYRCIVGFKNVTVLNIIPTLLKEALDRQDWGKSELILERYELRKQFYMPQRSTWFE